MVPVYNTSKRETGPEYWQGMGLELPIKARTNYLPGVFNARHFLHSHSFLDAPFRSSIWIQLVAIYLRDNVVGTNFDFGQIRRFVPFVVSPFEEWIWDGSERMWEQDPHQPRILSASEAIKMLESRRSPQPTTAGDQGL